MTLSIASWFLTKYTSSLFILCNHPNIVHLLQCNYEFTVLPCHEHWPSLIVSNSFNVILQDLEEQNLQHIGSTVMQAQFCVVYDALVCREHQRLKSVWLSSFYKKHSIVAWLAYTLKYGMLLWLRCCDWVFGRSWHANTDSGKAKSSLLLRAYLKASELLNADRVW